MDAKQDVWRAIPALMGNGSGTVEVPNQPGYVYIRVGDGDLGQAFNNRCPLADNLAIYVGYDPVTDPDRRIFQVLSVRMTDYANAGNTIYANVANHHATHEFGGGDDVYIDWRRLLGFRVGRPAGFVVTVDQGCMMRAGAWAAITAQTVDLSASQPGGINSARYVLIALDNAGVITTTDGAIVPATTLTIADCPIPAAGEIPLAAVRLYTTQTAIGDTPGEPDIVDLRFPQTYTSGGSNLFGAGVANQFAYFSAADTLASSAEVIRNALIAMYVTKAVAALAPATITMGMYSDTSVTSAANQAGDIRAIDSHMTTAGAGNYTGLLIGVADLCSLTGTGTISELRGLGCQLQLTAAGTATLASAIHCYMNAGATGTIVTGYGVKIDAPAGSIGTFYGYYVGTLAAATTKWAFYSVGNKITTKQAAAAGIELDVNAATGNFTLSLSPANLTGNHRVTFGDVTGTAALGAGTLTSATTNDVTVANHTHEITGAFTPSVHNILDSTYHGDVLTGAITRGDLLYGNATPKIARLALSGAAGSIVTRNATDVLWSGFYFAGSAARTYTFPDYNVSWPAADAHGYLHSDGAGTLTWDAGAIAAHAIDGADHTVAGRTAGQVLIATAAATFGWSGFLLDGTAGGKTFFDVANTKTLTLTTAQDITLTFSTGLGGLFSINWGGAFTQEMYGGTLDLDGRSLSLLNGSIQLDTAAGGGLRAIIIPSDGTLVLGTGTQYQLAVWNGVNTVTGLGALGTSGAVLQSAGAGANPGWSTFYLAGTAAQTYTFPAAGGTVAMLNAANVFTASQTINGTALRIMGDFSNATHGSRLLLQSSTTNGNTLVGALPNGSGTAAAFNVYGNSDLTAALSFGQFRVVAATAIDLNSSVLNGGTQLPLTFSIATIEKMRIATDGKVGILMSPTYTLDVTGNFRCSTGFGCNGTTPQTAYASGGALAAYGAGANGLDTEAHMSALHAMVVAIRAALVANGIMS